MPDCKGKGKGKGSGFI